MGLRPDLLLSQTPQAQRQEYVNAFNKSNQRGGCGVGINLIGDVFSIEVVPNYDPSAMIYSLWPVATGATFLGKHEHFSDRNLITEMGKKDPFLTSGAIDGNSSNLKQQSAQSMFFAEKIYQRQVTKLALSDCRQCFEERYFYTERHTPSNTHDLLECPCDEGHNSRLLEDASPDFESPQANLDALEESDDDVAQRGFINATQVTSSYLGKLDKAYLEKKKAGLAALEEWKHINCLAATARDNIQDDILRQLLPPEENKEATGKTSGPLAESLLSAVDLDRLCAAVKVRSMSEVQGGTITFVFEKTVDKIAEDEG
ncbi:hypothetical protein D9756_007399 [Leucocoprinus leucothites]|uniref:Uncharacterized protein n=1 Tax=Leucocoprinus leucothites TaxID=201217 RepID=A0A8H5D2B1_9AGAR|nr:hypothetical protein D9756_007399 [Leucoagaricus leucothites]